MTIYNSTNNISEDYTFIIDINEVLYTQEELNTLNLDIYQYSSSQGNITWNTVNSSDIDDIYAILDGDLAELSNPNILDITADFSEILEESQDSNKTVLIYCGIQDDNRNGFPDFDDNQYFILLIHRNPESYYCIPIKSHILDNNIQIVDVETFEPLDFEYLSAKQAQNLIYSLISKIEILEFVETLPPKSSARTNCIYLLTETPSDPTDLIDDGLNLNFGLYTYSKTINDYKKLDTLTFNIKNFVKKTDIINNLTSTVIDAPLSAKQGKILNDNLASHTHGNIANDGKIGTSNNSNKNVVTDASGKITIENKPTIPSKTSDLVNDGSDGSNIFVSNNDNRLSDNRKPLITRIYASNTNPLDLNDFVETGFYNLIGNNSAQHVSNLPSDWGLNSFYLLTLQGDTTYSIQFIWSYSGAKSCIRTKVGTTSWTAWKPYLSSDNIVDNLNSTSSTSVLSAKQGKALNDLISDVNESKIEKGIIDGGVNLLTPNRPTQSGTASATMMENGTLYGEPIYELDLSSISDTTKYSDFGFAVTPDKFSKGDIFTLSFWAKGNNGNILKTYFAGTSGYVNVKRLRSNSTYTGNAAEGAFGDGSTTYNLTTNWQHYYVTYQLNTTGDNTLNKSVLLRVFGGNKVDVSRIKLERGEVATDYSSRYNQTTKVPSGADLNNYIRGGFYYNDHDAESVGISNLAETGKAFFLLVEDWEKSNYTKQTITHHATGKTYTRIRQQGVWTSWRQLALKSEVADIVDNLNSTSSTSVLSAKQGKILNDNKQDLLISGTNIKTINNQSLLGNGDIAISGGIELITTTNNSDEELAATSTTLSEVKVGTTILLRVINPFNTMHADSRLTLTLKNGDVSYRQLMAYPDSPTYLPSNRIPPNTIFLMIYRGVWNIVGQFNLATQSFRGLMSEEDKTKLDNTYTKTEIDALIGNIEEDMLS